MNPLSSYSKILSACCRHHPLAFSPHPSCFCRLKFKKIHQKVTKSAARSRKAVEVNIIVLSRSSRWWSRRTTFVWEGRRLTRLAIRASVRWLAPLLSLMRLWFLLSRIQISLRKKPRILIKLKSNNRIRAKYWWSQKIKSRRIRRSSAQLMLRRSRSLLRMKTTR